MSDSCSGSTCDPPRSCTEIFDRVSGYPDGVFTIDPDGRAGPATPHAAYCELSTGGYTLALKADGAKTTFLYDSPLWTDETLLSPDSTDMSETEAKLTPFVTLPVRDMRIVMKRGAESRALSVPLKDAADGGKSLRAIFSSDKVVPTSAGRSGWLSLIEEPLVDLNCNEEGFNLGHTYAFGEDVWRTSLRLGLVTNDQGDCSSPDKVIGIGAHVVYHRGPAGEVTPAAAGNVHGAGARTSFTYLLVR